MNVGPMANGKFPPLAVERLIQIGEWMRVHGEAIYGTTASPFDKPDWGRYTKKVLPNGKTILYLHFFDYQPKAKIKIPLSQQPTKAYFLMNKDKEIAVKSHKDSLSIQLPTINPDPYVTVLALEFDGNPFK